MEYVLTEHARDALKKREIQVSWMERALIQPEQIEIDSIDPNLEHRLACIPDFGNRVLRVIINKQETPLRVITVFFDRRRTMP